MTELIKRPIRKTERIIVTEREDDAFKRGNLLKNAELGFGKVRQVGKNLSYTVGSDEYGWIEYYILNATAPIV